MLFYSSESSDAPADGPDAQLHGRHGPSGLVLADPGPPDQAPGPTALDIIAGRVLAAGEIAAVGQPEGPVMVRALRREGMFAPVTVPEAGPQALGARWAEEGSLGLGDTHGRSLAK